MKNAKIIQELGLSYALNHQRECVGFLSNKRNTE